MPARSFAVAAAGIAALLFARPSAADQAGTGGAGQSLLADDLHAARRDLLLLVSAGLSRLGVWTPATAVSRELLADADDAFEACVAQAGVTWQTAHGSSEEAAFSEWNTLDRLVKEVAAQADASPGDGNTCRDLYRRVTGDLVYRALSGSHCGPTSVEMRRLEKVRTLFAAYLAAVQHDVAADRARPGR
jgi:hypothetical protein